MSDPQQACSTSTSTSNSDANCSADGSSTNADGESKRANINFRQYRGEVDIHHVMDLIDHELSEPYSIFTYRYFLNQWPEFCWLAIDGDTCCGTVVCKMDRHKCSEAMRGYVAMIVVDKKYRGYGLGSSLVRQAIASMKGKGCEEVVLEAEVTNSGALALYQSMGFVRDKRLNRYYLNGQAAYRLKLLLPGQPQAQAQQQQQEQQQQQQQQDDWIEPDLSLTRIQLAG